MIKPRIKICCIKSKQEARLAIQYGAAAIGLVGDMPSGPGVISDEEIRAIARSTPPSISTFLLTSETSSSGIIEHHKRTQTSTIQIVDALEPGSYPEIRAAIPLVKLVQVIHVLDEASLDEALRASDFVDALLLDSGNPNLETKQLGGTGRTHNWHISRRILDQSPVPVFLAGGLNPDNVKRALDEVQPFGVDVCSGVRTDGNLDAGKLAAFVKAATE